MSDYAVYIDEAGDLGIGRGTRWFVLTAVVVKKTVEPQIRARMTAIKACLNVREIHLRKITEFYKRAFIVRELRDEEFVYMNVLVDTCLLYTSCAAGSSCSITSSSRALTECCDGAGTTIPVSNLEAFTRF